MVPAFAIVCILTAGVCVWCALLLSTSFLSGTIVHSRLLCCVCPHPGIHSFFQELWFPFMEMIFKNQNFLLGVLIATGVSLLPNHLGRLVENKAHAHTFTSLFLYLQIIVNLSSQRPLMQHYNVPSSLSLSRLLTPFLDRCLLFWHLPCEQFLALSCLSYLSAELTLLSPFCINLVIHWI